MSTSPRRWPVTSARSGKEGGTLVAARGIRRWGGKGRGGCGGVVDGASRARCAWKSRFCITYSSPCLGANPLAHKQGEPQFPFKGTLTPTPFLQADQFAGLGGSLAVIKYLSSWPVVSCDKPQSSI